MSGRKEVFLTLKTQVWDHFRQAITPVVDTDGDVVGYEQDMPLDVRLAFNVVHSSGFSWGQKTVNGRKMVSAYIPGDTVSEDDPRLAWLVIGEQVIAQLMGAKKITGTPVEVLGVWERDADKLGAQYGTTVISAVYDDEGNEVEPERVEGTPIYPFDRATYIQFCDDDVTYDVEGNEVSRAAATAPKQTHKHGDQPARRW